MTNAERWLRAAALCSASLLAGSAFANPDAATRAPARDPMLAPADARPAAAAGAASAPAGAPAPARHLMVVDGQRFVVSGGRKRGVGDLLGDARIERIDDSAVTVRQDGALHRLPLYGAVQRKPAAEWPAAAQRPAGLDPHSNAQPRPARPPDAGTLSLARPERPPRPELRPGLRSDSPYRAGDPQ